MSSSFAVKSVSVADDETQSRTRIGPVTSMSRVSGSVWKTITSGRSDNSGCGGLLPSVSARSRWCSGPSGMTETMRARPGM